MNYFWDVVDWLLPPVRIIDDLTDHNPSESSYRVQKTTHHHAPHSSRRLSGKEHDRDRDRDRERRREKEKEKDRERDRDRASGRDRERTRERSTRERTKDRERDRERVGDGRASSDAGKEREQLRQRVQQLERENDSLLEQLRSTREELSKLSTAVFPTPDSRAQSLPPASYPASPSDALGLVHPILSAAPPPSPTSCTSPTALTLSQSRSQSQSQYSAEAALTDARRLRVLYTSLRATYTDARQTIRTQAEELASLKGFLSKTDDWSGAQLLQALADLNSEIIQLAASAAEEFAGDLRADVRAPAVAKARDRDVVRPALGREMLGLLEGREHAQDPTLVQFALQAWEVWCVTRVMDAFCYGLPADVDESFRRIFDRMQSEEPQPTTARWRALTYRHARSLLARTPRTPASEISTPDSAAPSPFNSAPASIASSSTLPAQLLSLTEANLRGVLAILALAGCTDARGLRRDPLRARFGSALARISARAERISGVVKEGVLSGLFEVVWCQPCRNSPVAKPAGAAAASVNGSAVPAAAAPSKLDIDIDIDINEIGANRGKGKEREWVEEVERARRGGDPEEKERERGEKEMFDWKTMENVYAGHCDERCRVLCTVELGLAFTRRLPETEEREERESVDGDGMVVPNEGSRPPSSLARPVSMGGVGLDAVANGAGGNVSRSSANGTVTVVDGNRTVRNLLLKPKVLLESVVDIL